MSCFQSHAVAAAGDCWQTSALNATLHASFSFTSARATPTPSVQISPWQLVIVVRVCFMRSSKGIFWVAALSRMSCFVTSFFFFFAYPVILFIHACIFWLYIPSALHQCADSKYVRLTLRAWCPRVTRWPRSHVHRQTCARTCICRDPQIHTPTHAHR